MPKSLERLYATGARAWLWTLLHARCLIWLVLGACPPVPAPVPLPPAEVGVCVADADVTGEDVCLDMFTPAGHSCVRCANTGGCIDRKLQIYCALGPCAADPLCKIEPPFAK